MFDKLIDAINKNDLISIKTFTTPEITYFRHPINMNTIILYAIYILASNDIIDYFLTLGGKKALNSRGTAYFITHLHQAVIRHNKPLVDKLINMGADPTIKSWYGFFAYQCKCREGTCEISNSVKKYKEDYIANYGYIKHSPEDFDRSSNEIRQRFYTLSHEISQRCNQKFIKMVDYEDLVIANITGMDETLLMVSAKWGNDVTLLHIISLGVDVNWKNSFGYTALHLAAQNEHKECFDILIQNGADPTITTNNEGALPYQICLRHDFYNYAKNITEQYIINKK